MPKQKEKRLKAIRIHEVKVMPERVGGTVPTAAKGRRVPGRTKKWTIASDEQWASDNEERTKHSWTKGATGYLFTTRKGGIKTRSAQKGDWCAEDEVKSKKGFEGKGKRGNSYRRNKGRRPDRV